MKAIQVGGWTCSQRPDAGGSLWAPDCVWGLYTLSASAWGRQHCPQGWTLVLTICPPNPQTSQAPLLSLEASV